MMRLLFFSDVHGVPATLERLFLHAKMLRPDRMIFLGDALYHGPRNGVPGFYDPVGAAERFNEKAPEILAVRGNCDAEVDEALLRFPLSENFLEFDAPGRRFFLTHGHKWNETNLPPMRAGNVLAHGHTHIPLIAGMEGITVFNPGSLSLPKAGFPRSFGFFDGKRLSVRKLEDGEILLEE